MEIKVIKGPLFNKAINNCYQYILDSYRKEQKELHSNDTSNNSSNDKLKRVNSEFKSYLDNEKDRN